MKDGTHAHPLLNPALSGVYRTPAHVEAVRHAVTSDALWVEVDASGVRSKSDLLDAFAAVLGFPREFGRNWDALADALQDLSWRPAKAYVLRVRDAAGAARALGLEWATLIEILSQTALYWKSRQTPFVAFIDDAAELPPWI
jgi:RNAse (barnase) inhibitor barstar